MSILERSDVRYVLVCKPFEGDSGLGYMLGHDGVTEIKIGKRHGPFDWLPYIEVWRGEHLLAECPQHSCPVVEFALPAPPTEGKPAPEKEMGE